MSSNSISLAPFAPTDTVWIEFYYLYQSAFPAAERRNMTALITMFQNPRFHPNIILENQQFVGLFNYWEFDTFFYIEHFAMIPEKRNLGIGKTILNQFQRNKTVVLECELPSDESSTRRIRFYSELGFNPFPYTYTQPPYSNEKEEIELLLLINNSNLNKSAFIEISSTIAQSVYQQPTQL